MRSAGRGRGVLLAPARHPRLARRQRRQHGGGQPALRRQRVGAPGRAGRRSAPRRRSRTSTRSAISQKAIEYEIERQIELLDGGGRVVQETRLFDSATGRTHSMRSKEEAHDYRYFPEPDLPPLVVDAARIDARARDDARAAGGAARSGSSPQYAHSRVRRRRADAVRGAGRLLRGGGRGASGNPKAASNWVMGELLRTLNERGTTIARRAAARRRRWPGSIALIDKGTISSSIAKDVFAKMYDSGRSADEIVAAEGLAQIGDESALLAIVRDVIGRERRRRRAVPRRQAADVRVPRRPGDEGEQGQGQSEAGQRAAQARAGAVRPAATMRVCRAPTSEWLPGCTGSVIETHHLSKLYSRGLYALRDLSLTVEQGRVRLPDRPERRRQVDASAAAADAGAAERRRDLRQRPQPRDARRAARSRSTAAASASSSRTSS